MRYKIFPLVMFVPVALSLAACSDDDPVLTTRDWDGTDTFLTVPMPRSRLFSISLP